MEYTNVYTTRKESLCLDGGMRRKPEGRRDERPMIVVVGVGGARIVGHGFITQPPWRKRKVFLWGADY